jgi:hypothetical protein
MDNKTASSTGLKITTTAVNAPRKSGSVGGLLLLLLLCSFLVKSVALWDITRINTVVGSDDAVVVHCDPVVD